MIAARGLYFRKICCRWIFLPWRLFSWRQPTANASLFSGGLAGAVGRQFTQNAVSAMTGQSGNPIGRRAFESSPEKGGDFANSVTAAVAQGNINYTGSKERIPRRLRRRSPLIWDSPKARMLPAFPTWKSAADASCGTKTFCCLS